MTNLTATLLITVSTNWLSTPIDSKELGIPFTNYHAQVVFDGKTNTFLLEKRHSSNVVWRDQTFTVMTNFYWPKPWRFYTNANTP